MDKVAMNDEPKEGESIRGFFETDEKMAYSSLLFYSLRTSLKELSLEKVIVFVGNSNCRLTVRRCLTNFQNKKKSDCHYSPRRTIPH